MPRSWFVKTILQDGREFLVGAASGPNARVKAEAIFTDGFSVEVVGVGLDQKAKFHPLREVREVLTFWGGEE